MMAGYKQSELGLIPSDWEVVALGDICTIKTGGTPSTNQATYWNGDINWCTPTDITSLNGKYLSRTNKKISELGLQNSATELLPIGTVLMTSRATIGECVITSEPMTTNQGFKNFICGATINNEFLYYLLTGQKSDFISLCSGSTFLEITTTQIRKFEVFIPKKPEQTAIATALSDTDALLAELGKLLAKKQAVKTAAMQQLLTGKTRLPQFAKRSDGTPKGRLKTEWGDIPEDWEMVALGDLAEIQRGASPRPIDSPIWFNQNSNIGWLRISDVTKSGKYLYETVQNLSEDGVKNSRYVSENHLVMSICATVGRPIINKKQICIHDGFIVFNNPRFNIEFMFYILQNHENTWAKHGQTGSQMNLNTDLIKRTKICIPQYHEQTAIAQILSDMDSDITALQAQIEKVRLIKQGMMQNLLIGKIRLPF